MRASFSSAAAVLAAMVAAVFFLGQLPTANAELTSAFRSDFDEVVLIDGMSSPTDLDVAPDGSDLLLLCEQGGSVYAVTGAASATGESSITHYEIGDLSRLMCHNGSRGLVGIAFHPDFNVQTSTEGDGSMWVYAYYTAVGRGDCFTGKWEVDELPATAGTINVLSRFPLRGNPGSSAKGALELDMDNEEILLETAVQMSHNHNGGDIAFGSDGMLYLTLGDGLSNKVKNDKGLPLEQATDALFGKIIRLTPNGKIPTDNPYTPQNGYGGAIFCGSPAERNDGYSGSSRKPCMEVYISGLRNPFRFAFHPDRDNDDGTPMFFINDVGGSSYERILNARRGANYGYPDVKGPCTEDGCDDPEKHGWDRAYHWYEHDSERGACISDGTFIPAAAEWPAEFAESYLFGEYKLGGIYRISPGGKGCDFDECKVPKSPFEETQVEFSDATASVAMIFGPYNGSNGPSTKALYFLTRGAGRGSNEKGRPEGLVRISYNGVATVVNDRPVAAIDVNISIGFNPLTVNFDGTASTDPDGNDGSLKFAWDLDGDGKTDSIVKNPVFVYNNPGEFTAELTVTDPGGAMDKTSIDIIVDNAPPKLSISSPSQDQTYFAVGDTIRLAASATDSEDGVLPSSAFTWEIRENHGGFYHSIASKKGNNLSFVMRPPIGTQNAGSAVVEVIVTATDSRGLSSSAVKVLRPAVSETKPKYDMKDAVDENDQAPSTVLVESTPNLITAQLVDFAVIISLDANGFRRKLGENKKSPLYPYLNDHLEELVSGWLKAELKQLVKSSGIPYAKPVDIQLERKSKKGHDDGSRYEVVFGGTVTYQKRKDDQLLPSLSDIQQMQQQVLSRVGDDLVDEIHSNTPEFGYLITSIVTDTVYYDPSESNGGSEAAVKSEEESDNNSTKAIVLGVCFGVAGIGIIALVAFFIARRKSSDEVPAAPAPKTDLNDTDETCEYAGHDL